MLADRQTHSHLRRIYFANGVRSLFRVASLRRSMILASCLSKYPPLITRHSLFCNEMICQWHGITFETKRMLTPHHGLRFWLCTQPTDMRKSFDGLAALVEDPDVVIQRRRKRVALRSV